MNRLMAVLTPGQFGSKLLSTGDWILDPHKPVLSNYKGN